jgi:hypothetical protein
MTGPLAHWHVDDIEADVKKLLEAGAETVQAIWTSAEASSPPR